MVLKYKGLRLQDIDRVEYDLGARRYNATGETLPATVLEELRGADAIVLGAIGDPSVPPGVLERGVLLPLRFHRQPPPGTHELVLIADGIKPGRL